MTTEPYGQFDRDTEDEQIVRQPPAAVGNPGSSSVLDALKAKFEEGDTKRLKKFKAKNRYGLDLTLEMDLDSTSAERREYREAARTRGNRAARRNGEGDVDEDHLFARLIGEKNVAIYYGDPEKNGPELDIEDDPLTLRSEEWCAALGFPRDPVGAAMKLFTSDQLAALGAAYSIEAGIGNVAEVVDPTPVSSGD